MPTNVSPKFAEAFQGFEDNYVLIGGTATSIVLDKYGLESRTTKDYDMVLIDEEKNQAFYTALTTFLTNGEYIPYVLDKENKLFRFTTEKEDYPKMIELFCLIPDWFTGDSRVAPIHFDDDMSLSALLLDENYYSLLKDGREILNGYSVLSNHYLIVFKAKAWLDLSQRKEQGDKIDNKNIKKHLNDIARLTGSLTTLDRMDLPDSVRIDMINFLEKLQPNKNSIPKNDDILLNPDEVYQALESLLR